jgi:hypothetical protein
VDAEEVIVMAAVTADVPVMVADAEEQAGSSAEGAGPAIEQVRLTAPVKPPKGVTVMVADAETLGLVRAMLAGPLTPMLGVGTPLTYTPTPLDVDEP